MEPCKFTTCEDFDGCTRKNNPWDGNRCCKYYNDYANQDHVNQREVLFSYVGNGVENITESAFDHEPIKSKSLLIVQLYFLDHKTPKDISIHLELPRITVYKAIQRFKDSLSNGSNFTERVEAEVQRRMGLKRHKTIISGNVKKLK
jgi:hypothetical protein